MFAIINQPGSCPAGLYGWNRRVAAHRHGFA